MLVSKGKQYATFRGEDGERMTLRSNLNPLASCSEVVELSLECDDHYFRTSLDHSEVTQLSNFLKLSYSNADKSSVTFCSEEGARLIFRHSNMGEPYREGVDIRVEGVDDFPDYLGPFVHSSEASRIRDFILQ